MTREIRAFVYGREYIPTSLAESSTCRLLIVTDDQIEVLRTLVNYAHQRRSWNDETIDDERYYMPSDEDWDDIEALVDDLEDKLMSNLDPVDGDLIIGNVTPEWSKLAVSIPGADLINVLAVAHADLRPSWKAASSNPGAAVSVLATNAAGALQLSSLGVGSLAKTYATIYIERICGTNADACLQSFGTCTLDAVGVVYGAYHSMQLLPATSTNNPFGVGGFFKASLKSNNNCGGLRGGQFSAYVETGYTGRPSQLIGGEFTTDAEDATFTADWPVKSGYFRAPYVDTGSLSIGAGLWVDQGVKGAGTYTTQYGLYINDINVAASNYAIYTKAGDVRLGGKFGCNAATPQAAAAVNAACTDLTTAVALLNQIRALLVANGQAV
jgi:hypothetical protein